MHSSSSPFSSIAIVCANRVFSMLFYAGGFFGFFFVCVVGSGFKFVPCESVCWSQFSVCILCKMF